MNPAPFRYIPFGFAKIYSADFPTISVYPSILLLFTPVTSVRITFASLSLRLEFP